MVLSRVSLCKYSPGLRYELASRSRLALALLFAAVPVLADTPVPLVIGNSANEAVGILLNPSRDAALIADTLTSEGFTVTLVQNASRATLVQAVDDFNDKTDGADWAKVS